MSEHTDHSMVIDLFRKLAGYNDDLMLAADLLEMHDNTSLSLDNWPTAQQFIEQRVRFILDAPYWSITPNHA